MAGPFSDSPVPLKEDQFPTKSEHFPAASFMTLDEVAQYQWVSSCGLPIPPTEQGSIGYPTHALPQSQLEFSAEPSALFDYTSNGLPYSDNYNLSYSPFNAGPTCPRSHCTVMAGLVDLPGAADSIPESYPPSAYLLEPQRPPDQIELSGQASASSMMPAHEEYDPSCQQPSVKSESAAQYTGSSFEAPSSSLFASASLDDPPPPSDDGSRADHSAEENGDNKEQPYAQLIYRALMDAPGHTMILRDIYNWFINNTDKALDKETKGWQNSIRHNLSMNGAFKKVDQPGEESKKGFMWRLTEEAIREGVKSTTRYRSKAPNKRGCRSQNPAPQRQASGAKGGQAARKAAARMRRSERLKDGQAMGTRRQEQYVARSVPAFSGVYDPPELPNDLVTFSYDRFPPSPYYSPEADFSLSMKEERFSQCMKQEGLSGALGSSAIDRLSERANTASPLLYDHPHLMPYCPADTQALFYESNSPESPEDPDDPRTPGPQATDPFYVDADPGTQIPGDYTEDFTGDDIVPGYRH